MIFAPALARKVLAGAKTQTRRAVQPGRDCRYRPHHTYAVCPGRGKPAAGRILITDVREERAGDITFAGARAEGFRTTGEFKAAWVRLHDKAWVQREETRRAQIGAQLHDDTIVLRFDHRHVDTPVWVIEFTLPVDPVRLLADRHAKADYVDTQARALPDEPEAVDEQTQARISKDARMRKAQQTTVDSVLREAELGLLSLGERLDRAVASMREDRRSAASDVRVLEKRVGAIERKAYRDAA